jgi:ribonuclease VapC
VIAVDTSALIAILANEPEAQAYRAVLMATEAVIGAPTYLEFAMVAVVKSPAMTAADLAKFVGYLNVTIVDFTVEDAHIAQAAFRKFGKGRHKAALNFGDCASYATAKVRGYPLLFKGDDFSRTDVVRAVPPQ